MTHATYVAASVTTHTTVQEKTTVGCRDRDQENAGVIAAIRGTQDRSDAVRRPGEIVHGPETSRMTVASRETGRPKNVRENTGGNVREVTIREARKSKKEQRKKRDRLRGPNRRRSLDQDQSRQSDLGHDQSQKSDPDPVQNHQFDLDHVQQRVPDPTHLSMATTMTPIKTATIC